MASYLHSDGFTDFHDCRLSAPLLCYLADKFTNLLDCHLPERLLHLCVCPVINLQNLAVRIYINMACKLELRVMLATHGIIPVITGKSFRRP